MKAYGIKRYDFCCPGHNSRPKGKMCYSTQLRKKWYDIVLKSAKSSARQEGKRFIDKEMKGALNEHEPR